MKNIVLLGSTGSIGTQTLNVIRRNADKFRVIALAANENAELLSAQADQFKPKYVGICSAEKLPLMNISYDCEVFSGKSALSDLASVPEADVVVCAVAGMSAFDGVISAVEHGKDVALASKEVLVEGGEYVMRLVGEKGARILPVDSEHSAVWQCLDGKDKKSVSKIILTASGGPFYGVNSFSELENVTPRQAVAHPNWKMGRKISVDSATMMNKGLEIIEAGFLFGVTDIDYIVHPQSIIHSMVRFIDGSTLAQMSSATMELPILVALSYPERVCAEGYEFRFDKPLSFLPPREDVFVFPALAKQCLAVGKNAPCILSAADEAAVQLFLGGKIKFTDIWKIVGEIMSKADIRPLENRDDIAATHAETYDYVMRDYKKMLASGGIKRCI